MKQYTVESFIDQFVFTDTKNIMQNNPYQAFALLSIGLEMLGRCFCKGAWEISPGSETDFYTAIQKCPELQKYQVFNIVKQTKRSTKNTNELYSMLRCGMAHSLLPDKNLVLVPDKNDLPNYVIGCDEFYMDAFAAWQGIKTGKTAIKKNLTEAVFYVDDIVSGGTPYNVTIEATSRANS